MPYWAIVTLIKGKVKAMKTPVILIALVFGSVGCGVVTMPDNWRDASEPDRGQPDTGPDALVEIDAPVRDACPDCKADCRVQLVYLNRYEIDISEATRLHTNNMAVIVNHGDTEISLAEFALTDVTSVPALPTGLTGFRFVHTSTLGEVIVPGQTAYGGVGGPEYTTLLAPYVTRPWTSDGEKVLIHLDTGVDQLTESTTAYALAVFAQESAPIAVEMVHDSTRLEPAAVSVTSTCLVPM
jgi:hypothetical protein